MHPNKYIRMMCLLVLGVFWLSLMGDLAYAQKVKDSGSNTIKKDPNSVLTRIKNRVTNEQRRAAAVRAAAKRKPGDKGPTPIGPISPSAIVPPPASAPMPLAGTQPDYYGGVTPNWAWTQPLQKFVDTLPGLTAAGANNLGQYIPVAIADTTSYPGSDYYEIELGQYTEKMHTNLPATKLQGYRQTNTTDPTVSVFHYLGPAIVAQKNRPVRIKFTNSLPTGMGGNLFIPVDTTDMGAGMGPNEINNIATATASGTLATFTYPASPTPAGFTPFKAGEMVMLMGFTPADYNGEFMVAMGASATSFQVTLKTAPAGAATVIGTATAMFTENRATLHLHGGQTPWISDGTPHQWTTPATESTSYPKGVSVKNVPDMPDPGPGSITFFYTNQQSARLMFYHDHAWGITRLNVYAGEAAPYLVTDQAEQDLITAGLLPAVQIPLVIQDRTFVDASTLPTTDPTWNWGSVPGSAVTGNLFYPHVYMPNQNPNDLAGVNAMGRWDYGPFFWPPWPTKYLPYTDGAGLLEPNLPNPSMTMEAYHDTPLVNGTAYPKLNVDPKVYRFRILNAANDRMWNLQLYQASSIVDSITITNPGSGYTTIPTVTITPAIGDTTGMGATALATVDLTTGSLTYGQVTAVTLNSVGSGYTAAPTVTIAPPGGGGTTALATATFYNAAPTEVGMVPAVPGAASFPVGWTIQTVGQPGDILDNRAGGVPDPRMIGPSIIQIGTEGGFLPTPVVWPNTPVGFERNPKDIVVGNVKEHNLFLGPAERADVLIDFSAFAGKTLILYNDSPAAVPAPDSRLDYYTADVDQTVVGGHAPTLPGYGPNTRTIMQIVVSNATPAPAYNLAALQAAFASTATTPGVFAKSQDPIIVPQGTSTQRTNTFIPGYNTAYNASFPTGTTAYSRIQSTSLTFNPLNLSTPAPAVGDLVGTAVTLNFPPKAIQELFENDYGRMNATLGVELKFTNGANQTTIPYGYVDPPTELVANTPDIQTVSVGTAGDGTQIWKITHNGVDTHPVHFHLFNVQLINRVGWDGAIRPPEENELGWKETVRMNPLEDCIVALRATAPLAPFGQPNSMRPLNPMMPLGVSGPAGGFSNIAPDGTPTTVTNVMTNFGYEYVWHCHILSHEEMDMMRPMVFDGGSTLPVAPVLTVLGGTTATLTWTDATPPTPVYPLAGNFWANTGNEIGFRIERSVNGGAFAPLALALANATSYIDATINPLNSYQYRVIAFNAAGDSVSNIVSLAVPPSAPLNVSVVAGDAQATVTFSAPASNGGSPITLYTVTSSPGGIVATSATVAPIVVTGLTNGTPYTFTITATNAAGTGPGVTVGPVTPIAAVPPAAPSGLTFTLLTGPKVSLAWTDNATTETGFVIERDSGTGFVTLVTLGAHTGTGKMYYTDATVQAGITYTYRVKAVNGGASSAYSNSVTVSVPVKPAAPSGLSASAVLAGTLDSVTLTWTDNSNNESGFLIVRSTSSGFTTNVVLTNVPANSTSYVQTGVPRGMTFYYRMRAYNVSGNSAWSNTASVVTP